MTISKRQFELLQAMEIPLWVSKQATKLTVTKKTDVAHVNNPNENKGDVVENLSIDLSTLRKNQLFNDILITMNILSTNISTKNNQLNLGKINWQFSSKSLIHFEHNQLTTPNLDQLARSPLLKRQLWQLLVEKQLT